MSIVSKLTQFISTAMKDAGFPEVEVKVEYPQHADHGDYSTNAAMQAANKAGEKPHIVAGKIIELMRSSNGFDDLVDRVEVKGPGFINFFINDSVLHEVLRASIERDEQYGKSQVGAGKTVIVEYSSPNTNKPLTLGHLRNNFIGMALANALADQGYKVLTTEIINDRGIHISKSMLAYQKHGDNRTPESEGVKGDRFVGDYYVKYSLDEKDNPEIIEEVRELLRAWENGDSEVRALWRRMNDWVISGWRETYKKIGSHFDFEDFESEIFDKGRDIILNALGEGKLEKVDGGAVAADLSAFHLGGRDDGKKILIRSDGTAMYITQDIYLAVKRWEEHKPERVLYVVGDEQIYHFKVLFVILKLLGYEWVEDRYVHVSYGMVNLPTGKMKSREGTVVDADDLISEIEEMARDEIEKREGRNADSQLLHNRAEAVALAALKFFILKVDPKTTMMYDPKASLDFEGATGPYLLYTYARLSSIVEKAKDQGYNGTRTQGYKQNDRERRLLVLIARYEEVAKRVADELRPNILAEYLLEFSSEINSWYVDTPVLKASENEREWRLLLIAGLRVVLKNGLRLIGIEVIEKM